MLTSLSPCPALPMGPVGYTAGCQAPKPGLPGLVRLSMGWDLQGVSRRGQKSRTCMASVLRGLPETGYDQGQAGRELVGGGVLGCPLQQGSGDGGILTICPTQTLAASIMAPSAMERADSFSMCGFPESSSSTTCRRGRRTVSAGLPQGRGVGRRQAPWPGEEHTLHFGILPG